MKSAFRSILQKQMSFVTEDSSNIYEKYDFPIILNQLLSVIRLWKKVKAPQASLVNLLSNSNCLCTCVFILPLLYQNGM